MVRAAKSKTQYPSNTSSGISMWDSITRKCPEYQKKQQKVIVLDDNSLLYRTYTTWDLVESYDWKQSIHAAYSPELSPSDYNILHRWGTNFLSKALISMKMLNYFSDAFTNLLRNGKNLLLAMPIILRIKFDKFKIESCASRHLSRSTTK